MCRKQITLINNNGSKHVSNPTQKTITERFLDHAVNGFNLADQHGVDSNWYNHAREQVRTVAKIYNLPEEYTSGVIAVLSANCSVSVNIDRSHRYFEGEEVEFSGKLADEYSRRYAATGDAAIYSKGTWLTTDKTNEFRINICPVNGDDSRITVDRHIADGATGVTSTTLNDTLRYRCIIGVRRVAKILGVSNCHTQALIWYSVRDSKGHSDPFSFFNIGDVISERLRFAEVS